MLYQKKKRIYDIMNQIEDHHIKEQLKAPYYIRYMDDMIIFHRNKKELHKVKDKIEEYLNKEHLKLKENWQLFKSNSRPIDFLRL